MRIFGTNQPEEAELREAAAQNTNNDHRGSAYSLTGSSGYDTADDDFGSEVFEATSNGQNLETPKSNNRGFLNLTKNMLGQPSLIDLTMITLIMRALLGLKLLVIVIHLLKMTPVT